MLFEVNIYVVNLIASKGTTICIYINLMIPKLVYCNFKLRVSKQGFLFFIATTGSKALE
jgi:hypothetical protein